MVKNTSNKTIAKNTLLLYFRMIVTMIVSLYTSRVILQILGVDDFGIYQAVGGIVGFLSFVNNALATGSSRFLTFCLGEGDLVKLKKTFSTVLTAHIGLALIVVVIAETVGLWFLHSKMIIPQERLSAAEFTFHISVLTAFFSLTQVPYNATIIAHERMNIYAYVSIIDAVCKLLIVYALTFGDIDKLKLYATLLCILQVGIMVFYRCYCGTRFQEARFRLFFEKKIFREIASFSGWSLLASTSIALNSQGVLLLLNMFFSPAVVAARAISIQVNMHAYQFVSNFQIAAVPQIVKRYASKEYEESKNLLLQTCKFSYYLMLAISLPVCLMAKQLLSLWLGEVPEYTVVFLQIIIVQSLFQVFDSTFYYALYAKGQLRENALISPLLGFIQFPIVYIMFKIGYSPVSLSWASLVLYAILGFIVKPILVTNIVGYKWSNFFSVFISCLKVTMVSLPLPLITCFSLKDSDRMLFTFLLITGVSVISVICASWFFGMDKLMRRVIIEMVNSKCMKKCSFGG